MAGEIETMKMSFRHLSQLQERSRNEEESDTDEDEFLDSFPKTTRRDLKTLNRELTNRKLRRIIVSNYFVRNINVTIHLNGRIT